MKKTSFTLIELLVVTAIIAILIAVLLPSLSRARESSRQTYCAASLRQISTALTNYADDFYVHYPSVGNVCTWGNYPKGWTEQLYPYIRDTKIFKCPSNPQTTSNFQYFLSARAAYIDVTYDSSVSRKKIEFPSAMILGGDCNMRFNDNDCDRDDMSFRCLNWTQINEDARRMEPFHGKWLNVMFADGHVGWHEQFDENKMTYRYQEYANW